MDAWRVEAAPGAVWLLSLHDLRVIRRDVARWSREDDEQRDHRERCDHQQLVIVNIGDDLGLAGHDSIESGASSSSNWVPKLPDRRVLKRTIDRCDV